MSQKEKVELLAMRPREAAKALNVSPRTLWAWTQEGRIPCVKIGSGKRQMVLYPADLLRAWLESEAQKGSGKGGAS